MTSPSALWARSQGGELVVGAFVSRHLDEIPGQHGVDLLSAYEAYRSAIQDLGEMVIDVMVALALPLPMSPILDTAIPDFAAYRGDAEPASLYLFERHYFGLTANEMEEYRVPMSSVPVLVDRGRVAAHYSSTRDQHARASGWEYARTIWLMHYA